MTLSLISDNGSREGCNDPVYRMIKHLITTHELEPGSHMDPEKLAEHLLAGKRPVHDALIRLAAKDIIEDRFDAGFFVKTQSQKDVRDVLKITQVTLDWVLDDAISQCGSTTPPERFDVAMTLSPQAAADIADDLTIDIARQSGDGSTVGIIETMNARSYFVRWKECELFPGTIDEVTQLCRSYYHGDLAEFRALLRDHHKARIARLPGLFHHLRQAQSDSKK